MSKLSKFRIVSIILIVLGGIIFVIYQAGKKKLSYGSRKMLPEYISAVFVPICFLSFCCSGYTEGGKMLSYLSSFSTFGSCTLFLANGFAESDTKPGKKASVPEIVFHIISFCYMLLCIIAVPTLAAAMKN